MNELENEEDERLDYVLRLLDVRSRSKPGFRNTREPERRSISAKPDPNLYTPLESLPDPLIFIVLGYLRHEENIILSTVTNIAPMNIDNVLSEKLPILIAHYSIRNPGYALALSKIFIGSVFQWKRREALTALIYGCLYLLPRTLMRRVYAMGRVLEELILGDCIGCWEEEKVMNDRMEVRCGIWVVSLSSATMSPLFIRDHPRDHNTLKRLTGTMLSKNYHWMTEIMRTGSVSSHHYLPAIKYGHYDRCNVLEIPGWGECFDHLIIDGKDDIVERIIESEFPRIRSLIEKAIDNGSPSMLNIIINAAKRRIYPTAEGGYYRRIECKVGKLIFDLISIQNSAEKLKILLDYHRDLAPRDVRPRWYCHRAVKMDRPDVYSLLIAYGYHPGNSEKIARKLYERTKTFGERSSCKKMVEYFDGKR